MIDLQQYDVYIADLERGETTRLNHDECPAGTDTKRRLYLTRPASSAGVVLGFCHNCQEHGVMRDNVGSKYRDFGSENKVPPPIRNFEIPANMEHNPALWPDDATIWRMAKGLSKGQCRLAHIMYDPSSHRIYLPMYDKVNSDGSPHSDGGSELMGFQLRQIDSQGPKYYTAIQDQAAKPYTRIGSHTGLCVLVEDLASGLIVSAAVLDRKGKTSVLVNYGIKVNLEALDANKDADMMLVWLDNDGKVVDDQARIIARTWALLSGKRCAIETIETDPKSMTYDGIINTLFKHSVS